MVKSTFNYRMLINIPCRFCRCAVPCAAPRGYGRINKKRREFFNFLRFSSETRD